VILKQLGADNDNQWSLATP